MTRHGQSSAIPFPNKASARESGCYREPFLSVEASLSQLLQAKHATDESLRRVQGVPGPHETSNSIFVALWETHLADREALFAAMRQLDEMREAVRSNLAELAAAGTRTPRMDQHRHG